ncbi:unnamed protein product [Mytilus coruscus]|uniref:Uncharacterized protein n=1 Tax=Mytilus coruscus TaxID=42192 RepID=A0A6J8C155_MYTCO|nr:unnamed protein product [Mytilus coruscus]
MVTITCTTNLYDRGNKVISGRDYGPRRAQRITIVKKTTEEAYETDSNTDISDYEEDRDYFGQTIKHIRKIRGVKTIQGIRDIEKTVTVRIDDLDVKVEPDSGADVNVMDENQFLTFQKKTYGNPVLEKSKIKLSTLQNSLPIKGEFTTVIRNETCGTETKFIVVKGKINSPPLIRKFAIEQGFKHYQVTTGRQRANREANVFRKPINKTEQITKLKKKNSITAKQETHRGYHSNLYEEINERDRGCKQTEYAENISKKMKKMGPPQDRHRRGRRTKVMGPPARQAREGTEDKSNGPPQDMHGKGRIKRFWKTRDSHHDNQVVDVQRSNRNQKNQPEESSDYVIAGALDSMRTLLKHS